MDPEGEIIFTNQMMFAMDMIVYVGGIVILTIFTLLFLKLISFVREKYPTNGRKGLTLFYLVMAVGCYYLGMPYVALIWMMASVLMLLDYNIHIKKEQKDEEGNT
tara:strand:- start:2397 stop:2711 length:315 start_codon:yes stop_codon:yes gene_type:complete